MMKRSREEYLVESAFSDAGIPVTPTMKATIAEGLKHIRQEKFDDRQRQKEKGKQEAPKMKDHKIWVSEDNKSIMFDGIDISDCLISYSFESEHKGYVDITLKLFCKTEIGFLATSTDDREGR